MMLCSLCLLSLYRLWCLVPSDGDADDDGDDDGDTVTLRRRPTMLSLIRVGIDCGFSAKERAALILIAMSNSLLFTSMQCEVLFMVFSVEWVHGKEQQALNALLLWSFHLSVVYLYVTVISIQWNASFLRASRFMCKLNASMIAVSLWNAWRLLFDDDGIQKDNDIIVVMFSLLRGLTSFGSMLGFGRLNSIHSFHSFVGDGDGNHDGDGRDDDEKPKHSKETVFKLTTFYVVLLAMYFVFSLSHCPWNGDLFNLNVNAFVLCGEPPFYGLLFHGGLLTVICVLDATVSKRWAPSFDLSRAFLLCTALMLSSRMIADSHSVSMPMMLILFCWISVSLKLFFVISSFDPLFPNKPSLFI